MPYRTKEFYPGGYYHIYNRGANREKIFFSENNYLYCLSLVKKYCKSHYVSVIAYCLMPNHYHFILRQDAERNLSYFIQVIFNAYVQAINKQIDRRGTLFEGRFKHIAVNLDRYLLHLCRYIHLNPVKANLVSSPADWPFSNYQEWAGLRNGSLVDRKLISNYFKNPLAYQKFVLEAEPDEEVEKRLQGYLQFKNQPPEGSN